MWCDKCHYGSYMWKPLPACPICKGTDFVRDNPFPSKPSRSIRAMDKRKDAKRSVKTQKTISEDVAQVIKDAQHNT